MPRSIWSGAISFGLVNVPVKLYSAVSRKTVRFHQLHDKDGVRIQQKRVCPADGEEVRLREHRQGLRDQPGPLRRDRDRGARGARSEEDALDRHPGVRGPRRDRPDLLRPPLLPRARHRRREGLPPAASQAMQKTNKVAIARVVIRQKENLVAIRATRRRADDGDDGLPRRGGLARTRSTSCPTRTSKASKREVEMARAADRVAVRRLRPDEVPGRVPRARARADRGQGRRRGDQRSSRRRSRRRCRT